LNVNQILRQNLEKNQFEIFAPIWEG
jgi:hypothetical protein